MALWGRVEEGERGWRASAAYPEILYVPVRRLEEWELCDRIAWDLSSYRAPIRLLDCTDRGVADALRAATRAARAPLPRAVAA